MSTNNKATKRAKIQLSTTSGPTTLSYLQNRPMGINAITKKPSLIATYLAIATPGAYTFHCFRRTGATLYIAGGGSKALLKIAGGWTSDSVCERYIEGSALTRTDISNTFDIPGNDTDMASKPVTPPQSASFGSTSGPTYQFAGSSNCTFFFGCAPPRSQISICQLIVFLSLSFLLCFCKS